MIWFCNPLFDPFYVAEEEPEPPPDEEEDEGIFDETFEEPFE